MTLCIFSIDNFSEHYLTAEDIYGGVQMTSLVNIMTARNSIDHHQPLQY